MKSKFIIISVIVGLAGILTCVMVKRKNYS